MSEEVKTEINNIKILCATRGTALAIMQKDIEYTKNTVEKIDKKIDDFSGKFAGKWVERFIVGLVLIFALAALYIIFDFVGLPR
jgi:hypothetical protein